MNQQKVAQAILILASLAILGCSNKKSSSSSPQSQTISTATALSHPESSALTPSEEQANFISYLTSSNSFPSILGEITASDLTMRSLQITQLRPDRMLARFSIENNRSTSAMFNGFRIKTRFDSSVNGFLQFFLDGGYVNVPVVNGVMESFGIPITATRNIPAGESLFIQVEYQLTGFKDPGEYRSLIKLESVIIENQLIQVALDSHPIASLSSFLRTSIPNAFAVGEINPRPRLLQQPDIAIYSDVVISPSGAISGTGPVDSGQCISEWDIENTFSDPIELGSISMDFPAAIVGQGGTAFLQLDGARISNIFTPLNQGAGTGTFLVEPGQIILPGLTKKLEVCVSFSGASQQLISNAATLTQIRLNSHRDFNGPITITPNSAGWTWTPQ